jgi:hypothetical protein
MPESPEMEEPAPGRPEDEAVQEWLGSVVGYPRWLFLVDGVVK